jgi:putative ATP-dependent endonuclease of the OLD family
MRISRVEIRNFRNFEEVDVQTADHIVIIGENSVGKSNFIHALRLILDPSLPESSRHLRREDFWEGLDDPFGDSAEIEVSIELTDFADDHKLLAVLTDYLIEGEPLSAKLTYKWRTKPDIETPTTETDYDFVVYGGVDEGNSVGHELRRRLPLEYFHALRDAEGDLARWQRSPLRPLVERASDDVPNAKLENIGANIDQASAELAKVPAITKLTEGVNETLDAMAGEEPALDVELRFGPSRVDRLLRSLRLFVDGGSRSITDASLGTANVIYLGLKTHEYLEQTQAKDRQHTLLAIEEPESHLHPHWQRLIFRSFLRNRVGEGEEVLERGSAILTTHSPHIVSVAPVRSFVLLRRDPYTSSTLARSAAEADLADRELEDIERYMDATRGEMLFARKVLLVEGDAERYLLPVLAKSVGVDLDEAGITVCPIGGTHFRAYVQFLGSNALAIPYALITDGDPNHEGDLTGINRLNKLLALHIDEEEIPDVNSDEFEPLAASHGLFFNTTTLEIDLFNAGNAEFMSRAFGTLTGSKTKKARVEAWAADPDELDGEEFVEFISKIGKGRYAQRLASVMAGEDGVECPPYIQAALAYLTKQE